MNDRTRELECVIADLTREAQDLRAELDAANRRAEYWKAEHLAANAELDALKAQDQVVVKIGNYGAAFDGPCVKRAYTYEHQPGNVVALKLGRAAAQASFERGGDFIDFGLSLLRALAEEGFGVFDAGAEFSASVPQEPSVPDGVAEALQRLIENGAVLGQASSDDALLVARYREHLLTSAPKPERSAYSSQALADVIAERIRQIEVEGWTQEHDDEHRAGDLARAAGLYANNAGAALQLGMQDTTLCKDAPYGWPWSGSWWKPSTPRRDLVKAIALCIAEIERMDRATEPKPEGE